jgi:hypothetical protein
MLEKDKSESGCEFSEDIVSYLYDELKGQVLVEFESHLSDCIECTDEFAAVSNARFSVYEWRNEAFAALKTPEISIPYRQTRSDYRGEIVQNTGWFDAIRGLFAGATWPPYAGAFGSIVAVVILGTFLYIYFGGQSGQFMAANSNRRDVEIANNITDQTQPLVAALSAAGPKSEGDTKTQTLDNDDRKLDSSNSTRPERVASNATTNKTIKGTQAVLPNRNSGTSSRTIGSAKHRRVPALNSYDDDEDNSLRLAELFDQIGSLL